MRLDGQFRGRLRVPGRNERRPGLARFGIVVGRFAGHRRDSNEVVAVWTLNLPPRECLVALEMLLALRAGELELVHKS